MIEWVVTPEQCLPGFAVGDRVLAEGDPAVVVSTEEAASSSDWIGSTPRSMALQYKLDVPDSGRRYWQLDIEDIVNGSEDITLVSRACRVKLVGNELILEGSE